MGRFDSSDYGGKRRREFLLVGIAGGAGLIALAALGVSEKTTGGTAALTPPKIPFASGPHVLSDSKAQYIAADPSISPVVNGGVDLGSSSFVWRIVNAQILKTYSSIQANSDNALDIGTSAFRFRTLYLGTSAKILATASDANPTVQITGAEIDFGPGGATVTDMYLKRLSSTIAEFNIGSFPIDFVSGGAIATQTTPIIRYNSASHNLIINSSSAGDLFLQNDQGGSIHINTTAIFLVAGIPATDNNVSWGSSANRWNTVYTLFVSSFGSVLTLSATGSVNPNSDNAIDFGTSALRWRDLYLGGQVKRYNGITPAGIGVPAIVAEGDSTGNTGTLGSIATFTVGASNGVFKVGGDIDVTAFTSGTINLQVTYTDWNNSVQTITIDSVALLADALGNEVTIMAKASTSITIKTTGTFTATYNVAATITWYK